jgi:hypothetical protein
MLVGYVEQVSVDLGSSPYIATNRTQLLHAPIAAALAPWPLRHEGDIHHRSLVEPLARRQHDLPTVARVQSGAASHAVHESFWAQAVAREDLLVTLKVDRVWQLTEHLADELIRVSRAAQNPHEFVVGPERGDDGHVGSLLMRFL